MKYAEIKKELLKNEDVYNVSINSSKKQITIEPIQNKTFYDAYEVAADFVTCDYGNYFYKFGDKHFEFHSMDHYNGTIYSMILKEI